MRGRSTGIAKTKRVVRVDLIYQQKMLLSVDFNNYAYAVYGRLYRALATFSLTPVIYQLRLQAAPIILQPGITDRPGSVPEFGEPGP